LSERDSLENPDLDWSIILKWILKKLDGRAWIGFIWLRVRTVGGLL
jgi:hypothetical protein